MISSLHRLITREALKHELPELFPREVAVILGGNTSVDYRSIVIYRRRYHVDRIPFSPHADAWEMGILALQEREARIIKLAAKGRKRRLLREIGAFLHTAQDFFSHTNFNELDEAGQRLFTESLLEYGSLPPGVKVCSYSWLYLPSGHRDPYTHRANGHDAGSDSINREALSVSREFLQRIRKQLFP